MKALFIYPLFFFYLFWTSLYEVQAQNRIKLNLSQLWCDQTTEHGEDEVYIVVIYKGENGSYYKNVFGPYDMNDGNPPRSIDNIVLISADANEAGTIIVAFMEQDGGTTAQWQEAAEDVLKYCPSEKCLIAQQVSSLIRTLGFNIVDTDDYIGSFSVSYGFRNGQFWHSRQNLESYCGENSWGKNGYELQFCGDGSNYTAYLYFSN